MTTLWEFRTIDALCHRVTSGGTPSRSHREYYGGDIPWIKTGELLDREIVDSEETITAAGLANSSAKLLPPQTVLMAMYGATVGALGRLGREATCNQASCAMIVDPQVADARWLFYALLNDRPRIVGRATGAAQQNLSAATIKQFTYRTPPLPEQRAIAEVLGALDDKISANTALVSAADDLMHRTFLSAPPAEASPLSSTADFVNGKAFTKGASGTGRVVVRIAELNAGISNSTVFSDALVDDKHVSRPGDILFAWSGSLTLHRWFRDEAIVNQHIFKVIPGDAYPGWLVFELLRRKLVDFKAIAADKATTMGHIQRHHLDAPVALPSAETVQQLDPMMSGLWAAVLRAQRESLTLASTRDTLLPQLMSGKLRVRDAEAAVSAAGV